MIPGTYDITIYKGDSYYGPLITLPDLSGFGGPSELSTAVVEGQIRAAELAPDALAEFAVEVVDEVERKVRLTLTSTQTEGILNRRGVWDLQIIDGEWTGTVLKGSVTFSRDVTR